MELEKIVFHTKESGPGAFKFDAAQLQRLHEAAPEARFVFTNWNDDVLFREATGCDAVIAQNNHPLPTTFYERAADLKWVHCLMSGVDRMQIPDGRQICLTATKGTHGIPISEHILALMLNVSRKLYVARDNQRNQEWIRPTGITELRGATAGILGFGQVGIATARLLCSIGMNVVASSVSAPSEENMALLSAYYPEECFYDFLKVCDYVILSLPLTVKTENLFQAEQFSQMKSTAWLINVSRGRIVDENALFCAIRDGQIAGACLDVVKEEPLKKNDLLWNLPNIIITPHVANETPQKMERITDLLLENIRRYQKGLPLLYQVLDNKK